MNFEENFDAIIMLTWSDWKTEPRSNRYHYATRFARHMPVLFLQHCYLEREGIQVEPSGFANIDLVRVSQRMSCKDVLEFRRLMAARGIRRPLLWIYDSLNYTFLIDSIPRAYRVYHATEDYLTYAGHTPSSIGLVTSIKLLLEKIDLMISCSTGVAEAYVKIGGYEGPYAIIENGCDAEYFLSFLKDSNPPLTNEKPIVVFQGGINERLDYALLNDVVSRMPDVEFKFCGKVTASEGWSRVLAHANVHYLGEMHPDSFARVMCNASVGIIPFIQDDWIRNSLPLKAYEYVACGLPVVTVPIDALERDSHCFAIARDSAEFEQKIRASLDSRHDAARLERCKNIAIENSYDSRFAVMLDRLLSAHAQKKVVHKKLRVAILYDAVFSMHVQTIVEHLESFAKYSQHDITYIPATPAYWNRPSSEIASMLDMSVFDVVVIHYSTRLSIVGHLEEGIAKTLELFTGLKILFIQDEYESTEIARSWMDRLSFDVVYTCVPPAWHSDVYPKYRFPATEFISTLTGYVPENRNLEDYALPLEDRKVVIAYRGRKLPEIYGDLGQEKLRIGVEMKAHSERRGICVDIEVDDSKRIYGDEWYRFMGSARATLGTESGSNIFDFDGTLKLEVARIKENNPDISYSDISAKVLAPHEGRIHMNQISPKVFEAIRLRTALVLFEGEYSGVVRPNEHFIPLKKDFSNIDEVYAKLADDDYLKELTSRAYKDVVASGKYSYKAFIHGFDSDIESRVLHARRARLLNGPLLYIDQDGNLKQALPEIPTGLISGYHPLGRPLTLKELEAATSGEGQTESNGTVNAKIFYMMRRMWRSVPLPIRKNFLDTIQKTFFFVRNSRVHSPLLFRVARYVWRRFPKRLRARLSRRIDY